MITINLIDDIWDKQVKKRLERYDQEANEYAVKKMKEQVEDDIILFIYGVLFGIMLGMLIIIYITKHG